MDTKEHLTGERTFRVGMWAKTGLYFEDSDPLTLKNFPIESGNLELVFSTYRETPEGFTAPVPFGFSVIVEGSSDYLGKAVQDFGNTARGLTALLSVAANAAIGEPTAFIALETTPGSTNREFWTQNLDTGDWAMVPGRLVTADLFPPMVEAFYIHEDQDRFHRAIVQYHHALQQWEPGTEIAALNHIWIGMEALTRLVRSKLEKELGVDAHELAKQYLPHEQPREDGKYNLSKLDAEIRLRHLFQGDIETHKWAKKASDGYEHSYDPLWTVRDRAVKAAEASLGYLRSAIFEYSGIDSSYRDLLMGDYFVHPHTNQVHIGIQGKLTGQALELDQIDPFPDIQLHHEPAQYGIDPIGDARVVFRTGVRVNGLAPGVKFQPDAPEIVALPGTVGGTELILGGSRETIGDDENRLAWQADTRHGRGVLSITDAGLLVSPINAQPLEVVSADSHHEYRVIHVNSKNAGTGQERLTEFFIENQPELAMDGWELLCIIPSEVDQSVTLVCRREIYPPDLDK